ncbi:LysE family translocator [Aurantimonas sp. Leaf443]|uniref:LysE family translocator n=1 Tax=Aurantimonas sp. Leaf443 TaxID=1736378 RepID=UPI0006FB0DC6|nr:LysE family translocator [Aurantimonas sp. Leaf443]KQT84171.1 lysine transporter LysE [Aurantimonas sp. Leaf443]
MSPDFLPTSLIVIASPGTGVVVTLAADLTRGTRAAMVAAFGCTLGIVPHMLAAITGLAALLHASALAFEIIKYAGVAYLLYMAWHTLNEHGPLRIERDASLRSDRDVIVSAVLVTLLNPKLSIFFFAFLPQFVSTEAPGALLQMVELSLVFMGLTFAVFALYGAFAAAARERILSRPAVMTGLRRAFAAAFLGLGARLALTER